MTKIQILGSGCDKCRKLAANAQLAAEQLNLPFEIEKIEDINQITAFGVMMTPALAVNGKVVSSGKVLTPDEITGFLSAPSCDCGGQCASTETKITESSCCCGTPVESTAPCCENKGPKEESTSCCCGGGSTGQETTSCCGGGGDGKKKIMTIVLLIFVVASIVFMVVKQMKGASSAASAAGTEQTISAVPQMNDVLTVYYFHGNQRCMTCNKIEQLTQQAVENKYPGELASGKIVFRAVNVEEPGNEHFVKDFSLTTRSVVMQQNGKFKKFDEVWTFVREPEKFTEYIQDGAAQMMEGK